jgi:hypothetical protein
LHDEYTPEIKALIEEYNASAETFWKWHSEFKSAHDLLAEADASAKPIEKVFWLDGVGAEWLSLMLNKLIIDCPKLTATCEANGNFSVPTPLARLSASLFPPSSQCAWEKTELRREDSGRVI